MIDDITKYVSDNDLTAVIFEMNLVGLNPKDGGLILVLPAMHAFTRRCSSTLNQLRLGERCSWGTRPPLKSRVKEKWS